MYDMDKYEQLKLILNDKAQRIVFFTGAGISVPSGIPDFRSASGLYNEKGYLVSPEEMVSHHFFMQNPQKFFSFYFKKMVYLNAKANAAHIYIGELEKKNKNVFVVTQNIDGLHQQGGSQNVIELHGSVHRNFCTSCDEFYSLEEIIFLRDENGIPRCKRCNDIIKPDVVLYEEQLDQNNIYNAINVISNATALVVIGTSLAVYPAASFLNYFKGNHLIVINKEKTSYDSYCELVFNEDIISVINKIA